MIPRTRCLILASVILTALATRALAQNADSAMRVILARTELITDGASRYRDFDASFDSLGLERWGTGPGRLVASFEGDTLRMIVAKYSGITGPASQSFYFWKGAPVEIAVRLHGDGGATAPVHGPVEQRFYFDRGSLIRWVDPAHTIHPVTTGAIFARAMQLMASATRLVDAARGMRERDAVPASPDEIANAMRSDLEGLVTAEQSYHAAVNTYSSDIAILSYHPVGPVQVALLGANERGWAAQATTASLPGKSCVVYQGKPPKMPKTSADHAHPNAEREVICDRP